MPNGTKKKPKPKPKQLTSIIELTPPKEVQLGEITGEVNPPTDWEGQHIVNEYTEGYALLVVRTIPPNARWPGIVVCATDHFLLTGTNESDQERFSMAYTIGDPVLRGGKGRRPRMFAYSGVLVDTQKDGSGISIWRKVYEKYLRASACVNRNAYIELTFRDQFRRGYITNCDLSYNANQPQRAGLTFVMFVIGVDRAKS